MHSDKTPRKPLRMRGRALTRETLALIDQKLAEAFERSEEYQLAANGRLKKKKLTREWKTTLLGIDAKTLDKIFKQVPVDVATIKAVFLSLGILSSYNQDIYLSESGNSTDAGFIGREALRKFIRSGLEHARLVTLTGPGGIGKTRLALKSAHELEPRFDDGFRWVRLETLTEDTLVPQAVAEALGLQDSAHVSVLDSLSMFLKEKRLLLVLDNCEHLLNACAALVEQLASVAPDIRFLATSRERLKLPFELPIRVPPLSMPDSTLPLSGEAVRLFEERARVHNPEFEVTEWNGSLVASITRRLDGIPLAIELAAARMGSMSLKHLERELTGSFSILTEGNRTAPRRHQTLTNTMNWSYDLLDAQERALFYQLSVFTGGIRADAAKTICCNERSGPEEMQRLLLSLVDKSLVIYEEQEEESRYRLLEPVRQFAAAKLAEQPGAARTALQNRHRDFFLTFAETARKELEGSEQSWWYGQLQVEHENIRAALGWSLENGSGEEALRLCVALTPFWRTRGFFHEGRQWCSRALAHPASQERSLARGKALNGLGTLNLFAGDLTQAHACFLESSDMLRELQDTDTFAYALSNLGQVICQRGDYELCLSYNREALAVFEAANNVRGMACVLANFGAISFYTADYAQAEAYNLRSIALFRQREDRHGLTYPLHNMGELYFFQGEFELSGLYFSESLEILGHLQDLRALSYALRGMGLVHLKQGDRSLAQTYLRDSLALRRRIGDLIGIAGTLEWVAEDAANREHEEQSSVLWAAAAALRSSLNCPLSPAKRAVYDQALASCRIALGENRFSLAWTRGELLRIDPAIELALETVQSN